MKKNILALQIPSIIAKPEENFLNLEKYLDEILSDKNIKPDFLFLPEVWSVGWCCEVFKDCADNGATLEFLSNVAKKYNLNIFGGSYIRYDADNLKNSMPVILKDGSLLGFYDKIHLYTPDGEGVIDEGKTPCIFEIDGLRVGVSICYDIRFPELFRCYINTKNPPHLLVNLSAWPLTRKNQYSQMAASRAIENQSYFLALSQCGEIKNGVFNSGCSCVFDPMGESVAQLDENKGYIYFSLDTELVDTTRKTYPNLANRKVFGFGFGVCEYKNGSIDV